MDQSTGSSASPTGTGRPWLVAAIVALALAGMATAAIVLLSGQREVTYAPDTPEAAVQAYIRAWDTGDTDAAYAFFSSRVQARVPEWEFRHAQTWSEEDSTRIWIDERREAGSGVILELTVERTYDGFLRPSRERDGMRLVLIRDDGAWRIDTPLLGYHPR